MRLTLICLAMGLLASLLVACSRPAVWSPKARTVHTLDSVVHVAVPAALLIDDRVTELGADWIAAHFRRTYKTHINGQTSWAEALSVVVVAPDLPRDRFDAMLADGRPRLDMVGWGRRPGLGTPDERGLRWLVHEQMYERHPVREPAWSIRLDDRAAGILIGWRGFKKHYTLEAAKENLRALHASIRIEGDLARRFATRRSWGDDWPATYAANLAVVRAVGRELSLPLDATGSLGRAGAWRVAIDDERPQRLHLAYAIAGLTLPDGPFRTSEPVTYFQNWSDVWRQENQGKDGGTLPESLAASLAPEHPDKAKVYFYRIRAIDLWKRYGEGELASLLRRTLREIESEAKRWLRDGFIEADAEP